MLTFSHQWCWTPPTVFLLEILCVYFEIKIQGLESSWKLQSVLESPWISMLTALFCTEWSPWKMWPWMSLKSSQIFCSKKGTNAVNRFCRSWSFFLSKKFLLFQQIYVTAGHVLSENVLLIETFRPPTAGLPRSQRSEKNSKRTLKTKH